jgi:hypothetical protein
MISCDKRVCNRVSRSAFVQNTPTVRKAKSVHDLIVIDDKYESFN